MATVVIIEDEPSIGALVRTYLERDGWEVAWARTARDGERAVTEGQPAAVVLDLGLPDGDGLALAGRLAPDVPLVILTARGDEADRLAGFALGADDYVAKPFSPRELVARVRAVVRRAERAPRTAPPQELALGAVLCRPAAREVRVDGRPVELTVKEFDLLRHLLERAGTVVTRDALLAEVWGFAAQGQTRTVDQHVAQLRAKLGAGDVIRTVRGIGYKAAA